MSTMIDFWGNLGATAGQGAGNFLEGRRFLEERDRLRKQQDEDRARQRAAENYNLNAKLIPGMLQAGQYEAAAEAANRDMEALRGAGYSVPNAAIMGGTKATQTRLDPTPSAGVFSGASAPRQGPLADFLKTNGLGADSLPSLTPAMSFSDAMTQGLNAGPSIGNLAPLAPEKVYEKDFSNPQTQAAIRGAYGIQPQGFELSAGQSYYTMGADGKPQIMATAPYPENPYRLTAEEQARLKLLGYDTSLKRTQITTEAAGERQDKNIQASTDRQTRSLQAADAKTFGTIVNTLAADFPGIQVTSGQRSHAEQQRLWDEDLKANGGKPSGRVARPGHSAHETGLARDVYVPPAQREAFIAAAQAQGLYVKADYPDGHIHIAVPQNVRPAAPVKPKLITQYQEDGTGKRVRDGEGVSTGKKPTAPKTLKPWDSSLATSAWREAEKKFPDKVKGFTDPETQKKRQAHVDAARNQYEAARRKASGEQSALGRVVELMEAEARERGAKQPF